MKKRESVQFFGRFLILSLLSILNIALCLSIVDNGKFLQVVAALLAIGNVFVLIIMLVKAIVMFFKHIFDKDKKRFEFLYFVNIVLALIVTGLYLFFYFILVLGVLVILLPFLA